MFWMFWKSGMVCHGDGDPNLRKSNNNSIQWNIPSTRNKSVILCFSLGKKVSKRRELTTVYTCRMATPPAWYPRPQQQPWTLYGRSPIIPISNSSHTRLLDDKQTYDSSSKCYPLRTGAHGKRDILDVGAGDVFAGVGEEACSDAEFRVRACCRLVFRIVLW